MQRITRDSQDTSVMFRVRVPEKIARDFRIACAVNDDTSQDALLSCVMRYVRETQLPSDMAIGKSQQ